MKKIYPKQWLQYHPYTKTDAVDRYYCDIVNKLLKVIYEYDIAPDDPIIDTEELYQDTAIFLGAWFEDVISQTGVWQAFTSECEKRYGSRLPFYELNDNYFYDEINEEDIRFILWHCFQRVMNMKTYNPNHQSFIFLAEEIYAILFEEYETAPENERLQQFFNFSDLTEDNFLEYRSKIEWFFMKSYINKGCEEDYLHSKEDLLFDLEHKKNFDIESANVMIYSHRVNTVLQERTPLLAITAPEYIKLIQELHQASPEAPYMNIKAKEETFYLVDSETDDYFVFKALTEGQTCYKVAKQSFEANARTLVPGDTLVTSSLFKYGEYWFHNGAMINYSISENPGMMDKMEELKSELSLKNEEKIYKEFIKATKGKPFVFFKDMEELADFVKKNLKYKNTLDYSKIGLINDFIMLSATPQKGLCIMRYGCECVASPDNPYYDQKEAEKKAIALLTNDFSYLMSWYAIYMIRAILRMQDLTPTRRLNEAESL